MGGREGGNSSLTGLRLRRMIRRASYRSRRSIILLVLERPEKAHGKVSRLDLEVGLG